MYISDIFNDTVSRLDIGLKVDVVGILRHYLNVHVQDCSKEPATNSSMTSEDFQLVIRNAVMHFIYHLALFKTRFKTSSNTPNSIDFTRSGR